MNIASVLQSIASFSWLIAMGVIGLAVFQASRGQKLKSATPMVISAIAGALLLSTVSAGMVFIQPEERGVVISAIQKQGYRSEALQPGLRWVVPYVESVVLYPISRVTYTMSIAPSEGQVEGDDSVSARTADGQEVFIDASVIFAVNPNEVVNVHIAWQKRYVEDLIRPLVRGIVRDEASQFGVEEIYSERREDLTIAVREGLETSFAENGLVMVEFVLRNIAFSPEYATSVEQKQIAEQKAQEASFVVERKSQEAEQARQVAQGVADAVLIAAEGRAESRLIEAAAEAEALELIALALAENPELLTFEYIKKIASNMQTMLVPSDSPYALPEIYGADVPTLAAEPVPESGD